MSSSNIDAIIPAYAAAVRDVHCHSIASLTFLVWDSLLTFGEDVQYIWTMRNKNPFKWMYFFLRYVVILAHVTHNILIESLANGSNPPMLCSMWHAYILVFTQILATSLELILACRIFALYNRSRRIAFLLSILILTEVAGTVRMLWLHHGIVYHGTCLLIQLTKSGRDQSILGFIVHCMFIGLTLFKYCFAFRAGWGRTPLVSLVIRDGTTVYATNSFLLISVLIICGLENERGVAVFFWATSLLSVSGCGMILRMERLARKEVLIEPPLAIFTSKFTIGVLDSARWHDPSVL